MTRRSRRARVGVGVGEVGGQKVLVAELLEYHFGHEQLFIGKAAEVQNGEGLGGANSHTRLARLLTAGMPPVGQQTQCVSYPTPRRHNHIFYRRKMTLGHTLPPIDSLSVKATARA